MQIDSHIQECMVCRDINTIFVDECTTQRPHPSCRVGWALPDEYVWGSRHSKCTRPNPSAGPSSEARQLARRSHSPPVASTQSYRTRTPPVNQNPPPSYPNIVDQRRSNTPQAQNLLPAVSGPSVPHKPFMYQAPPPKSEKRSTGQPISSSTTQSLAATPSASRRKKSPLPSTRPPKFTDEEDAIILREVIRIGKFTMNENWESITRQWMRNRNPLSVGRHYYKVIEPKTDEIRASPLYQQLLSEGPNAFDQQQNKRGGDDNDGSGGAGLVYQPVRSL